MLAWALFVPDGASAPPNSTTTEVRMKGRMMGRTARERIRRCCKNCVVNGRIGRQRAREGRAWRREVW